jgi:mRNA-degrading endonuclease RelE of RelBE toxin-antitoxin system
MFTFIESKIFERELPYYLDDEQYRQLQDFMIENPEAGDVVPRSGGVRKLRWGTQGKGKRGGVRIIYYAKYHPKEMWMLAIYAKSKQTNAPAHILKQLKEEMENDQKT